MYISLCIPTVLVVNLLKLVLFIWSRIDITDIVKKEAIAWDIRKDGNHKKELHKQLKGEIFLIPIMYNKVL